MQETKQKCSEVRELELFVGVVGIVRLGRLNLRVLSPEKFSYEVIIRCLEVFLSK